MVLSPFFHMEGERVTAFVEGSSGTEYRIDVYSHDATCSCPDYERRQQNCKHIVFLFGRVCQRESLARHLAGRGQVPWGYFPAGNVRADNPTMVVQDLHELVFDRLIDIQETGILDTPLRYEAVHRPRAQPPPLVVEPRPVVQRVLEAGEDCPICFERMEDGGEGSTALCQCRFSCGRWYHSTCMAGWRVRSNRCPLCRGRL